MSDPNKHFERTKATRFKPLERKQTAKVDQEKSVESSSAVKQEVKTHMIVREEIVTSSQNTPRQHYSWHLTKTSREALQKLLAVKKEDLPTIFKDKMLRQQTRKEEKRLTKGRTDQKLSEQSDIELSFLVLNNLLNVSEEMINELTKDKQAKTPVKNVMRVNQEKEMTRQITIIDEQLAENNILGARVSIQNLMKKFGKDEFLQGKVTYLTHIQSISQKFEKQISKMNDWSKYLEKLSSIDNSTPQAITQSNVILKSLKKDLTLTLVKQNKKPEPNQEIVKPLGQFEKIANLISGYFEPKVEKKGGLRKQLSTSRDLQLKGVSQGSNSMEEALNYCKDLLQKSAEDKQVLFKELQNLKRNRKKATEAPYNLIIRVFDQLAFQKKEINEYNLYLKVIAQLYFKKNLNPEALQTELKKAEEKYVDNEVIGILKPNLENLVTSVQQKQRAGKQLQALQQEIKKIKTENERLNKVIQNQKSKIGDKVGEEPKIDRKKEMQEKRLRQVQKSKADKLEKDIQKALDNVFVSLADKKWKPTKNAINIFIKRFEEAEHPLIFRSIQSLNGINSILTDLQALQFQTNQIDRKEKAMIRDHQKQKQSLSQQVKAFEDYEVILKDLLENYGQDKYPIKKFFDDIKRDRKKIVQERYMILNKLQEPLNLSRSRKFGQEPDPKNISLTYSQVSVGSETDRSKKQKVQNDRKQKQMQIKMNQLTKDVEQLLSLISRVEKEEEWWKFIPRNVKNNSTFKPVYIILDQYRKNELKIQALEASSTISKDEDKSIENALNLVTNSIVKDKNVLSQDYWNKKMAIYKGKISCEKLTKCLNDLNAKFNARLTQENQKMTVENQKLSFRVENLQRSLSDKERSMLIESSSKKSLDLKGSRRSSRSRDKKEEKSKQFIESFIQDERNYLNKIEDIEKQKQILAEENASLDLKIKATEQDLYKIQIQFKQLQRVKADLETEKYRQFNEINNLKGELQIAEGRVLDIQTKYESELSYFKQLSEKVQNKVVEETTKTKQLEHENSILKQNIDTSRATSEVSSLVYTEGSRPHQSDLPHDHPDHPNVNLNFKVDLDRTMFGFVDSEKEASTIRQRRKQHQKAQQQQRLEKQEQHPQEVHQEQTQIQLLRQRIAFFAAEINKQLLVITDLTTENNSLKVKLQTVNQKMEILIKELQSVKAERKALTQELKKLSELKNQQIDLAVKAAVKVEVDNFNNFLQQFKLDQEKYYLTQVLPIKVDEAVFKIRLEHNSPQEVTINMNSEEFLVLYRQKHEADMRTEIQHLKVSWEHSKVQQIASIEARCQAYWQNVMLEKQTQWRTQNPCVSESDKEAEWKLRQKDIEKYWQTVIIPKIRSDWQQEKKRQIQNLTLNQPNIDESIQNWKEKFLPSVIEHERQIAIEIFIRDELPNIVNHEYSKWLEGSQAQRQEMLKVQWEKWEISKNQELNSKLKEIQIQYQNQLIEWQQKLFKEQQRSGQIETSLRLEMQNSLKERGSQENTATSQVIAKYEQQMTQEKNRYLQLQNELNAKINYYTQRQHDFNNKLRQMQGSFAIKLQSECERVRNEKLSSNQQALNESRRRIQIQVSQRVQIQIRKTVEHQFQIKMGSIRADWQRAKIEEINVVLGIQIKKCEEFHANEFRNIMIHEKQVWEKEHQEQIKIILQKERIRWDQEKLIEIQQIHHDLQTKSKVGASEWQQRQNFIRKQEEEQFSIRLTKARSEWELSKVEDIKQLQLVIRKQGQEQFSLRLNKVRSEWETSKAEEIRNIQLIIRKQCEDQFNLKLNKVRNEWEISKSDEIRNMQLSIRKQGEDQFNLKLNKVKSQWEASKVEEFRHLQLNAINVEYQKWQMQKNKEINHILTQEKNQWLLQQQQQINIILNRERLVWQKQKQSEIVQKTSISVDKLNEQKAIWLKQQQNEWNQRINLIRQEWQKQKTIEINNTVKEVQHVWTTNVLVAKQKEWRDSQSQFINDAVNKSLAELEKEYNDVRIPSIIEAEYHHWVEENRKIIEVQRGNQGHQFEQQIRLLRLDIQASEQRFKELNTIHINSENLIKQLQLQLSQNQIKLQESSRERTRLDGQITKLRNQQHGKVQQVANQTIKLNEELTKSRLVEQQYFELKKVIDAQREQIRTLSLLHQQIQLLKRETMSLKEVNIALENSKLGEITQIKDRYEAQLLELTSERKRLINQLSDNEVNKYEGHEKDSFLSLERQITTLLATIKTKDAEIVFLKRSIDTHKDELVEARDQYSEALKQKHQLEKVINDMKGSKKEIQYQMKYLKEREENLKKTVESKDEQISQLKNRSGYDLNVTESKTETVSSFQHRFSEIQNMLSLKNQECQSMIIEIDRLRYEIQRSEATIHSNQLEMQSVKVHLRDSQTHFNSLKIQHDRAQDEISRIKKTLNQSVTREEEVNKKLQVHVRTLRSEQNQKLRVESQLHKLTEQYNKLWRDFGDIERVNRREIQRATMLERQLKEVRGKPLADSSDIQILAKINKEVSELTATNRQLTMKIVLLQNQTQVNAFSQDIIKFFLLLQKHTDLLIDGLLKEGIIPNLESYHRFLSESRPFVASGEIQVYFVKWEALLKQLFDSCLVNKSQEMRSQAQELLRLKQEMNDILDKQIEASESDSGQLVEDYKAVLLDIKSLVREYMSSGDSEYLNLLCQSLGIPLK